MKKWISVAEYTKLMGLSSTQLVYNRIAVGKMKKDVEWREVEVTKKVKQVLYEDNKN